MIVELDVPFTDTAVSHLGYLPHAPALPVLAALEHSDLVPDGHLSLRLLGASHQAVLRLPTGEYAETVACASSVDGPLPARRSVRIGQWRCRLSVEVVSATTAALEAACREMHRCALREDPRHSLYGSFPGHPLAVTFLRLRPDTGAGHSPAGAEWTTAHVYPESGHQVRTRTEIRPVRGRRASPAAAAPLAATDLREPV